ncbi:MAG: hypothetical protein RBQ70_02835 [Acholeplasma sp.]|nr:hypothetical protein [Acholeplasma sp.]
MNNKNQKKTTLIKRYKRSISLDTFIFFIPMAITFLTIAINQVALDYIGRILGGTLFSLMIVLYLIQDYILKNSIGKRIFKIKIDTKKLSSKTLLSALVTRRVLEFTYHPMFNSNFQAICEKIDRVTDTKIIAINRKS